MGPGSKWWWSPAALLVLLGGLTLVDSDRPTPPATTPPRAVPAHTPQLADEVVVRDASGHRQRARLAPSEALVLSFPVELRGQRVAMKVFRRIDGAREAEPWLTLQPKVRADGTLPMAGLVAGDYVVEVAAGDVEYPPVGVRAPGCYAIDAPATPPR